MEQTIPSGLPSGNDPALLPQVQGWNWGGFFLTWIWAFAHRVPVWGAVALVANLVLGFFGWLGFGIYFGVAGNDLAWRNRPFESLQQFRDTQRIWAYWAIAVFVFVSLVLVALMVAIRAVILMPVVRYMQDLLSSLGQTD